jgi:hypothetical protein
MPQACWSANAHGEYWIDVNLGGRPLQVLVDSGLIDARGQVGFSVDASLYDRIKQSGGFHNHQMHTRLTADGKISQTESGSLDVRLISPQTRSLVGQWSTYMFSAAPPAYQTGLAWRFFISSTAAKSSGIWIVVCGASTIRDALRLGGAQIFGNSRGKGAPCRHRAGQSL